MSSRRRRMTRFGNVVGVWMYRTLDGRLSSGSRHVTVLMITTPGRRTGIPRSTCVRYLDAEGGGYLVWGTGSGSPSDPDWFQNMRKARVSDVQIRARRFQAVPRELHGEERETVWNDVILRAAPEVTKFAQRAGRTIPVAVLEPVQASRGAGAIRPS